MGLFDYMVDPGASRPTTGGGGGGLFGAYNYDIGGHDYSRTGGQVDKPKNENKLLDALMKQSGIGGGFKKGIWEGVKDIFDANSETDKENRRARGEAADYFEQQKQMGNKRPVQNVGGLLVGQSARYLNTLGLAGKEANDTLQVGALQALGQHGLANRVMDNNRKYREEVTKPNGGLLGMGTIYDDSSQYGKLSALDLAARLGAVTAGTALEIAPYSKGAGVGGTALYKGLSKPVQVAARTGLGALENTVQDLTEQKFQYDKWNPTQSAMAAGFGAIMPNIAPMAKGVSNFIRGKNIEKAGQELANTATGGLTKTVGSQLESSAPVAKTAAVNVNKQVKAIDDEIDAVPLSKRELEQGAALGMTDRQLKETKMPDLVQQKQNLLEAEAQGRDMSLTESLNDAGKQRPMQEITMENTVDIPRAIEKRADRKDLVNVTSEYLGSKNASKTLNTAAVADMPKLSKNESLGVLTALESGNTAGMGGNIRKLLDDKFKQLQDAGVDIGYLKDYVPHKWLNESKVKSEYRALQLRSGIQNPREIPTLEEGLRLGYKLASDDYRQVVKNYLDEADRLISDRNYFAKLQKDGFIIESATRPEGMVVIDAPGMPRPRQFVDPLTGDRTQGNWYADPSVAKGLNRVFAPEPKGTLGKVLGVTAKISGTVQNIRLSAGIPGTGINAFWLAQVMRHISGGSLAAPIKGSIASLSQTVTNRWAKKHAATVAELQSQGISVRPNFDRKGITSFIDRVRNDADQMGGVGKKFRAGLAEAFHTAVDDPTFGRALPVAQVTLYEHIKKNLMRAGVPEAEAITKAAGRLEKFEGMTKLGSAAMRNQAGQDALATAFFAPKYRESMINFWANNVKALYPPNMLKALNPKDGQYRNNLVFLATSFSMLAYMNELNKQYNDGRDMWNNPPGKEFNLMIPQKDGTTIGVPWLSSIFTVPKAGINAAKHIAEGDGAAVAGDAKNLLSVGIKPLLDVATNEDHFGNKIRNVNEDGGTQAGDVAKYLAGQYSHQYVTSAMDLAQGDPKKKKSDLQIASETMEMPFRFSKTKNDNTALAERDFKQFWSKADNATKKEFEALHPGRNEFGEYEELTDNPAFTQKRASAWQNSKLFELEKEHAKLRNKYTGKPYDPIFDLAEDKRKNVLAVRSLEPGTDTWAKKALYKQPWYSGYQNKERTYYKELEEFNSKAGYAKRPSDRPVANMFTQMEMDKGDFSSPEAQAYMEATNNYTNRRRQELGFLTPDMYQKQRQDIFEGGQDAKTLGQKLAYMQNIKLAGFDTYDKFFSQNSNLDPLSESFRGFKKGYSRYAGGGSKIKLGKLAKIPKIKSSSKLAKSLYKVKLKTPSTRIV